MDCHSNRHLGLSPQCGICADVIARHERVIALFRDNDTASYARTRPFPFPQPGHALTQVDGFLLCRYPDCKKCAVSPEFAPIHYDCYKIFRGECAIKGADDALCRLWTLAAWRNPWRGAQPLYLSNTGFDTDTLRTIAELCRLPQLYKLPVELLHIIQGYSRHSLFWRCMSALQLAGYVSSTKQQPLQIVRLSEVLSWERNGKLEHAESPSLPPSIRVTIDSNGISRVERLSHIPQYSASCSNQFAFIVMDAASISGVIAQLQDGLLRLQLPIERWSLPIWNTPAPPRLPSCKAYPAESTSWQRFSAIEMDRIRGITFFYSNGQPFGIHIHQSEESSALSTYERFSNRCRRGIVWIYLPIPRGDRLLVLGVRKKTCKDFNILARMEKTGEVIIGRHSPGRYEDRCLSGAAPVTLIYGEPREGSSIPFFGAYCRLPPLNTGLPRRFPPEIHGPNPICNDPYFSCAPLDGVSSAVIFFDESTAFCRGIQFRYRDGGSRSIGQCRLHVDRTETVVRPLKLCFRAESYPSRWGRSLHAVQVRFRRDARHERCDEGWKCFPLVGVAKFWFTNESSYLAVET